MTLMAETLNDLSKEYALSLKDYLNGAGEAGLERAYEVGRRVISAGFGVLDLVAMYREALAEAMEAANGGTEISRAGQALTFFTESLSPFEMTHRGFQETNVKLQRLTSELEQRVEERTRALQEREVLLERSNADLRMFANVIAHDLQEPLRTIESFLKLLRDRYTAKLDTNAKDFIDFAVDGADRLQAMINDMLVYSRVGTQGKEFTKVDMNNIAVKVIGDLGTVIAESGAEVEHDVLPEIIADPFQMSQLLLNLIINAIKFRGKELPRVQIGVRQEKDEWIFSVTDNGIGIDPEFAQRVFIIFQRLHARDEYPGTGVGLAICQRIVERHGGRIWIKSTPGKGTTVFFTIPTPLTETQEG